MLPSNGSSEVLMFGIEGSKGDYMRVGNLYDEITGWLKIVCSLGGAFQRGLTKRPFKSALT